MGLQAKFGRRANTKRADESTVGAGRSPGQASSGGSYGARAQEQRASRIPQPGRPRHGRRKPANTNALAPPDTSVRSGGLKRPRKNAAGAAGQPRAPGNADHSRAEKSQRRSQPQSQPQPRPQARPQRASRDQHDQRDALDEAMDGGHQGRDAFTKPSRGRSPDAVNREDSFRSDGRGGGGQRDDGDPDDRDWQDGYGGPDEYGYDDGYDYGYDDDGYDDDGVYAAEEVHVMEHIPEEEELAETMETRRSSRHRHREPRIQELIDDGSGSEGGSGSARQSHASASLDDFEATEANVQHRVHGALESHARQRPRGNNAASGSRREWNAVADGGGAEDSELLALARESRHQLLGVPEDEGPTAAAAGDDVTAAELDALRAEFGI